MRIVITTSADPALWRYTAMLAGSLAADHRAQVLLVALGEAPAAERIAALPAGVQGSGAVEFEALAWPLEIEQAGEEDYAACRDAMLRIALQWHAHILHAHEHHLGLLAAQGLPAVVVSHDDLYRTASAHTEDTASIPGEYRARVAAGLRSAALVVVTTAPAVQALSRAFGFSGVVRVIPNGVPPPDAPSQAARDIAAVALIDDATAQRYFDQASDGVPGLFAQAARTGAAAGNRVASILPGLLPGAEWPVLLQRAQMYVDPTPRAAIGLEHIDAALAGCAPALSGHPEHRWLWADDALYFDPTNAESLRTLLARALADPAGIAALGLRARARAQAHYTLERMVTAYLLTYQRLALRYGVAF